VKATVLISASRDGEGNGGAGAARGRPRKVGVLALNCGAIPENLIESTLLRVSATSMKITGSSAAPGGKNA